MTLTLYSRYTIPSDIVFSDSKLAGFFFFNKFAIRKLCDGESSTRSLLGDYQERI